jgi:hypothetical protein
MIGRLFPLLAAAAFVVVSCGTPGDVSSDLLEAQATQSQNTPGSTATTSPPTTRPNPTQPPPWTGLERIVETREYPVFATTGGLELLHPARSVERIGFHESSHDGAQQMEILDATAAWIVMDTRDRGNGSRTAADIVVDPADPVVAPISGRVVRAGSYTLYCEHSDNFLVIEPNGQPGWEVKMFHILDLTVQAGDVVVGGQTQVAVGARLLPFDSQVDAYTASPAWGHVHIEVVDPSIPDRKSTGGC